MILIFKDSINEKFKKLIKNLFGFKEIEVRVATVCTLITIFLLGCYFDVYNNFYIFYEGILALVTILISSYITLLGIMFTGIAIFVTLITSKIKKRIEERGVNLENLLKDYILTSSIICFQIILYVILYIALISGKGLLSVFIFYSLWIILLYLFFYTILVIVVHMSQCIKIYSAVLDFEYAMTLEEKNDNNEVK